MMLYTGYGSGNDALWAEWSISNAVADTVRCNNPVKKQNTWHGIMFASYDLIFLLYQVLNANNKNVYLCNKSQLISFIPPLK